MQDRDESRAAIARTVVTPEHAPDGRLAGHGFAGPHGTGVMALRLTDVTAGYGSRIALDEVSLEVDEGSLLAVIGPNGAGKSTCSRSSPGFFAPSPGR